MPISASGFSSLGAGVSDIFAGFGAQSKAAGDRLEAQEYGLAAVLADQNAKFTEQSTAIKEAQEARNIYKSLGQTSAEVAGAGFASSGSALDILRDSASQGALTAAVIAEQGLITEAGYKEQAASYRLMQSAANMAANAQDTAAIGDWISGGLKIAGGIAGFMVAGPAGAVAGAALGGAAGAGIGHA